MTYATAGRQFVIIAGGDGSVFRKGDEIIAFTLPYVMLEPSTKDHG